MVKIERDEPLSRHTTFHIGGPADYFTIATSTQELVSALEYGEENNLRHFVFSGGSNVLFSDSGFRGLVILLKNTAIRVSGTKISADAGATLHDIVRLACDEGLAGIENLAGIPGSFGGAIRGNAGAFGTEIGEVVLSVKCYNQKKNQVEEYRREDCRFAYRSSRFKFEPEIIILSATLTLRPGNKDTLLETAMATVEKRETKHPQNALCAGSFFMNPKVSDQKLWEEFERDTGAKPRNGVLPAGWLIDHVGLRGKKIGGAQMSPWHPNYLINTGNATADHVMMLASLVKQRVRSELGVQLMEEVQFVQP